MSEESTGASADASPVATGHIDQTVEFGEVNTTGGPAGMQIAAATNPTRSHIVADARVEYVSGGSHAWLASYLRTLPFHIDDITRDFGDDIYERMLLDPQVAMCANVIKLGVLGSEIQVVPGAKRGEDGFERATEYAAFVSRCLSQMETPAGPVLWNILDAVAFGNKIAEVMYEDGEDEDSERLTVRAIKVKPRLSVGMVIDVYSNVIGVLGLIPGQGAPILVDGMLANPDQVPNLLPRRKFIIHSNRVTDAIPTGRSHVRPAYHPWWLKQQVLAEWLKYAAQFGSPSLQVILSPMAQNMPLTDKYGNAQFDANNDPIMVQPAIQAANAAAAFRNGSYGVWPAETKLELLQAGGQGDTFSSKVDFHNREIAKAILCQTRATEEAEHGSKADSQSGQDVLGTVIMHARGDLETTLSRDLIRNLIEWNYGRQALRLSPRISLGGAENRDLAKIWTSLSALWKSGYLSGSQQAITDEMAGLPVRIVSAEEAEDAEARRQQANKEQDPADDEGDEMKDAA